MSMMIVYVFSTAESKFDNHFSPTLLDFAVQEKDIFAFLQKIGNKFWKKSGKSGPSLYFRCFLNLDWDKEYENQNQNEHIMPIF